MALDFLYSLGCFARNSVPFKLGIKIPILIGQDYKMEERDRKKIAMIFDLDGTLYNTAPLTLDIENIVREEMGYPKLSREDYNRHFQSRDWDKLCRDIGVKEEDIKEYARRFREVYANETKLPPIISGARSMLENTADAIGYENVHVVTNNSPSKVKAVFDRDGLSWLLSSIEHPEEHKAETLYELAVANKNKSCFYVGDIVSDGIACGDARDMGATNLGFYGVMHNYSFNRPEDMIRFILDNREFARGMTNIRDVGAIWSQ